MQAGPSAQGGWQSGCVSGVGEGGPAWWWWCLVVGGGHELCAPACHGPLPLPPLGRPTPHSPTHPPTHLCRQAVVIVRCQAQVPQAPQAPVLSGTRQQLDALRGQRADGAGGGCVRTLWVVGPSAWCEVHRTGWDSLPLAAAAAPLCGAVGGHSHPCPWWQAGHAAASGTPAQSTLAHTGSRAKGTGSTAAAPRWLK